MDNTTSPTAEMTQTRFESTLTVGQRVTARWTVSYRQYAAAAVVVRVNRSSIRIELTADITENGRVMYTAGRQFALPNVFGGGWSINNCVAPAV